LILTSVANAETITIDAAAFKTPKGWSAAKSPDAKDGPALVMKTDDGGLLAVTVAVVPNTAAYRRREKQAYLEDVIAGFAMTEGVKVVSSKIGKQGSVPSVDLWLKRGKQEVAVRVLLFRKRTIGIAVTGDSHEVREAAMRSLVPK
jgi:hypothetical protein